MSMHLYLLETEATIDECRNVAAQASIGAHFYEVTGATTERLREVLKLQHDMLWHTVENALVERERYLLEAKKKLEAQTGERSRLVS